MLRPGTGARRCKWDAGARGFVYMGFLWTATRQQSHSNGSRAKQRGKGASCSEKRCLSFGFHRLPSASTALGGGLIFFHGGAWRRGKIMEAEWVVWPGFWNGLHRLASDCTALHRLASVFLGVFFFRRGAGALGRCWQMNRPFRAGVEWGCFSWGFTPGWYEAAPSGLGKGPCGRVFPHGGVCTRPSWGGRRNGSGNPTDAAAFRRLPPASAGFFACVFFWRCSLGIGADGHGQTRTESRRMLAGSPRCARVWARRTGFPSLASQWPRRDVRFAKSNLSLPFGGLLAQGPLVFVCHRGGIAGLVRRGVSW
ncbi:MAG: hypothetical protein JWR26_3869 [Pedosphaera sp.]|nr:hypothetical protein [Pedosphaera sp.]